jgi:hypothetical protein
VCCILSPDVLLVVWQTAQIILSALSHSCTGGLASLAVGASVAVMLAFTAPILMLHTHSYKMVWSFCGGVIMCGASAEIDTA